MNSINLMTWINALFEQIGNLPRIERHEKSSDLQTKFDVFYKADNVPVNFFASKYEPVLRLNAKNDNQYFTLVSGLKTYLGRHYKN